MANEGTYLRVFFLQLAYLRVRATNTRDGSEEEWTNVKKGGRNNGGGGRRNIIHI
jgi:hypothetical protein